MWQTFSTLENEQHTSNNVTRTTAAYKKEVVFYLKAKQEKEINKVAALPFACNARNKVAGRRKINTLKKYSNYVKKKKSMVYL